MLGSIGSIGSFGIRRRGVASAAPGGGGDPGSFNSVRLLAGYMYNSSLGGGGAWSALPNWGGSPVSVDVADSIQQIATVGNNKFFAGIYSTAVVTYTDGDPQFSVYSTVPSVGGSNSEKCGVSYSVGYYTAIYETAGKIYTTTDLSSSAWIDNGGGGSAYATDSRLDGRIGSNATGTLIRLSVSSSQVSMQRSTNHGASWTSTYNVISVSGVYYGFISAPTYLGDGEWIAVGIKSYLSADGACFAIRSTDNGATWTQTADPPDGYYASTAYGNGVLIGAGWGGKIARSLDKGITWETLTSPFGSLDCNDIVFCGGRFFLVGGSRGGASPFVMWTTDGTTFTEETIGGSVALYAVGAIDLGVPATGGAS